MEFDDFPDAIAFEEDVGLLIIFVGDFTVGEFGFYVEHVTGDGGVLAGADLNVEVGEVGRLNSVAGGDVTGPFLFVGRKIGAAFGKPLRAVGGVSGEVGRQVVGGVARVDFDFEVVNFFFDGGRIGSRLAGVKNSSGSAKEKKKNRPGFQGTPRSKSSYRSGAVLSNLREDFAECEA